MDNQSPTGESPTVDPNSKFVSGKESVGKAAELLKSAAADIKDAATAKVAELKETATARAGELKSAATAKAEELKAAATARAQEFRHTAEERAGEFREKATHAWDDSRARVQTFQGDAESYIRENPTKAVVTALAAGFVLGLLFRGK